MVFELVHFGVLRPGNRTGTDVYMNMYVVEMSNTNNDVFIVSFGVLRLRKTLISELGPTCAFLHS